ncbi:MAG: hypothetical protein H7831_15060 [Magnetococcus sp. WYHC-3]
MKHLIEPERMMAAGALLLVSLLVTVAALWYGWDHWDESDLQVVEAQEKLHKIKQEIKGIQEQTRIIQQNLVPYQSLVAGHVIGAEARLEWVETLKSAGDRQRIVPFQYQLSPRQGFEPTPPLPHPGFDLYRSRMLLTMGLLHEVDLLRLFDILEEAELGLFNVRWCSLERRAPALGDTPLSPNVVAGCALDWLSLERHTEPAP